MDEYGFALDCNTENKRFQYELISAAEEILFIMVAKGMTEVPERQAVYLTAWKKHLPCLFFKTKIGKEFPNDEFRINCSIFSEEKIRRQFKNGHVSSYQSRNPDKNEWGGSIEISFYGTIWGISISGLKEHEDEALALGIPYHIDTVSFDDPELQKIVGISNNKEYVKRLFDKIDLMIM